MVAIANWAAWIFLGEVIIIARVLFGYEIMKPTRTKINRMETRDSH